MSSRLKLALPRCLTYYYSFYEVWASFFKHFDVELVVSPITNRRMVEQGQKISPHDICLPVKAAMGHCSWLAENTDLRHLFLPRLLCPFAPYSSCPKIAGFVDNVRLYFSDRFKIIDVPFNVKFWEGVPNQHLSTLESFKGVLKRLNIPCPKNISELVEGAASNIYKPPLRISLPPKEGNCNGHYAQHDLKVCVIGRTYTLLDKNLNMNLFKLLHDYGVSYSYYDDYSVISLGEAARTEGLTSVADEPAKFLTGIYLRALKDRSIDGIIYMSFFPCGPDSVVFGLLQNMFKNNSPLQLVFDEHTGEAGLLTRLEAFFDTLIFRKQGAC